jgi:hypothetical protein
MTILANAASVPLLLGGKLFAFGQGAVSGVSLSSTIIPQGASAGAALGPTIIVTGTGLGSLAYAMAPGQDAGGKIAVNSSGALVQGLTPISAPGSFAIKVIVTPSNGLPFTSGTLTLTANAPYQTTITFTNGEAASLAAPVFSANHQFGVSAIPAGSYPALYDSTGTTELTNYQIDSVRSWDSDGSMRRCVISMALPDTFGAYEASGQAKSYKLKVKSGSRVSTPYVTLSDVAAQDLKLVFSGFDCGSDTFQVRVNDIIANGAPGVYVGTLATVSGSSTGSNTLTFASLASTVTGSDGVVHPFTATKGMQVHHAGVPAGTYVQSVSGATVTLSAALTADIASAATISFDYPVYGYEVTKAGPVCSEWRFWSRLIRVSDGAVHRYVLGEIFLKAWAKTGHWEMRVLVLNPNCYGPHPTGSLPAIPAPGVGLNTAPTPRFVANAALQNGSTVLYNWGGVNDFRTLTVDASTFDPSTNLVSWPLTRQMTAYGYVDLAGTPFIVAAASGGTVPPGLAAGTPYWLCPNNFTNNYLAISPRHAIEGSFALPWASGASVYPTTYALSNGAVYYSAAGGVAGSTAPSGAGIVSDGGVSWECVSAIFGSPGSGNLLIVPSQGVYYNTGWAGADPLAGSIWWQGTAALAARPNLLFAPQFDYFSTKSKAIPPFDPSTPTYKRTTLDYGKYLGVTTTHTFNPNGVFPWGWSIISAGDDPEDERVGDISNNSAWLLRQPDDVLGAHLVRTEALLFAS